MKYFVLIMVASIAACGGDASSENTTTAIDSTDAEALNSVIATRQVVPVEREIAATVRSLDHIKVSAETNGRILRVHAQVGDFVKAGQLLAEVDNSSLLAAVDASKAGLELAQAEADRVQRLFETKVMPEREWDRAQTSLRQAKAQLRIAEIALSKSQVKSPSDGVVEARLVGPGDLAIPGTPLFQLYDKTRICLEAQLPVSDRTHAELGTELQWQLGDNNGSGEVSEIAPSSNSSSRTVRIRVPLSPNALVGDQAPTPGTFGTLRYRIGEREQISIPHNAVIRIGQVDMVSVREERGWSRRAVVVGLSRGGRTEIMSGLRGGEEVAVR